jgi:hypothetical protein
LRKSQAAPDEELDYIWDMASEALWEMLRSEPVEVDLYDDDGKAKEVVEVYADGMKNGCWVIDIRRD